MKRKSLPTLQKELCNAVTYLRAARAIVKRAERRLESAWKAECAEQWRIAKRPRGGKGER
jgi:hypothetical protein